MYNIIVYSYQVKFYMFVLRMFYCHFFFQAEDGIRDGHVTGVQTCALPICCRSINYPSIRRVRRACMASEPSSSPTAVSTETLISCVSCAMIVVKVSRSVSVPLCSTCRFALTAEPLPTSGQFSNLFSIYLMMSLMYYLFS